MYFHYFFRFLLANNTKIELLQQENKKDGKLLIQTEIGRVLPKTSDSDEAVAFKLKKIENEKLILRKAKNLKVRI